MPIKSILKAVIPRPIRRSIRELLNRRSQAGPFTTSRTTSTTTQPRLCVSHLNNYLEHEAIGPIQQSEALLLFAMTRVTQPRTLVEFGFNRGDSALNFLRALPQTSEVYSYDISEMSQNFAQSLTTRYPNFHYYHKSQTDFAPTDVAGRPVDFVFFDAAHDLSINQATWRAIEPALADDAIVAVHDTGTWRREHFLPIHDELSRQTPERWLNSSEFQHQIDERWFVNWIVTSTDFAAVHLHASGVLRHGLTILQKKRLLPTTTEELRQMTPRPFSNQ